MLPYAERIWRRFPQALLTLGHPRLEDEFELTPASGSSVRIEEAAGHKTLQVTLVRKAPAAYCDLWHCSPSPYHEQMYPNGAVPLSAGPQLSWSAGPDRLQSSNFHQDPNLRGLEINGSTSAPQWLPPDQQHNQDVHRALDLLEQQFTQLCAAWSTQSGQMMQQGRVGSSRFDMLEQEISQLCALWNAQKNKMAPGARDVVPQASWEMLSGQTAPSAVQGNTKAPQNHSPMQYQSTHRHEKTKPTGEKLKAAGAQAPVLAQRTNENEKPKPTAEKFKPIGAQGPIPAQRAAKSHAKASPSRNEQADCESPRSPGRYSPWKSDKKVSSHVEEEKKGNEGFTYKPATRSITVDTLKVPSSTRGRSTSPYSTQADQSDPGLQPSVTKPGLSLMSRRNLSSIDLQERGQRVTPSNSKQRASLKDRRNQTIELPKELQVQVQQELIPVLGQPQRGSKDRKQFQQPVLDLASVVKPQERQEGAQSFELPQGLPGAFPNKKTIIFFDWDDTICPTTWIKQTLTAHLDDSKQWAIDDECSNSIKAAKDWQKVIPAWFFHPLPDEDHWQDKLQKLQDLAIETICRAQQLGVVCIVTNAISGWVEKTMKRWLPRLQPYILGHGSRPPIKICYAQEWGDRSCIPHIDEFMETVWWKKGAMQHALSMANSLYRLADSPQDASQSCEVDTVISIGDSEAEMFGALLGAFCWHRRKKHFYPNPRQDPQAFCAHRRSMRSLSLTSTTSCFWSAGKPWIKLLKYKDEPSIEELQTELQDTRSAIMFMLTNPHGHCRYEWEKHASLLRRGKQLQGWKSIRRTQSQGARAAASVTPTAAPLSPATLAAP